MEQINKFEWVYATLSIYFISNIQILRSKVTYIETFFDIWAVQCTHLKLA